MADEEVVEADGQDEEVAKPPKDTTKTFIIALVGLSILLMVLTPVVTIFIVKSMVPEVNTETKKKGVVDSKIYEYVIEGVKCNLAGAKGSRYILLSVALEFNHENMKFFFEPPPKEGEGNPDFPESKRNRIMAKLIEIISDKQVQDLETVDDKIKLASDIKEELMMLLKDDLSAYDMEDASIREVYFPSFLIQ